MTNKADTEIKISFTLRKGDIYKIYSSEGIGDDDFLEAIKTIKSFLRKAVFLQSEKQIKR